MVFLNGIRINTGNKKLTPGTLVLQVTSFMVGQTKDKGFSYRPKKVHAPRLQDLVQATGHKKAFFLDVLLEKYLPELERRYAHELADLQLSRKRQAANCTVGKLTPAQAATECGKAAAQAAKRSVAKLQAKPAGKKTPPKTASAVSYQ